MTVDGYTWLDLKGFQNQQGAPKKPLYSHGQLGRFGANQNPQAYYNYALARAGLNPAAGSDPFTQFLRDAYNNIYGNFQTAQGMNRNLGFENFMTKQYGAPQHAKGDASAWDAFGQHMRNLYFSLSPTARGTNNPDFLTNRGSWSVFD